MPSRLWERIILALDTSSLVSALETLAHLRYRPGWVKIGPIALFGAGARMIELCKKEGYRIFLDLKLHDIPNTMSHVLELASRWEVDWVTIHTLNGPEALKTIVEKGQNLPNPVACIGVTVLTSHHTVPWNPEHPVVDEVLKLARWAYEAGCRGIVCSPHEVSSLREAFPDNFFLITPGIRLPSHTAHDQKRIATPWDAFLQGAYALVMGRSLRNATADELDALDEKLTRIEPHVLTGKE